ncbi:MAG: hypothetical protein DWQ09_17495 [Proteobacteria bacterium]|nr:MAG: hypothetical protein DWQ09_17495 [Pseudomonadota bacterium]QKK12022.1 MAG: hypothetical protein HND59_10960 [Pseudomonadota bacterium]
MKALTGLIIFLALSGCSSVATRMASDLSSAVLNQNDPETVRAGAPSYLILIDSLIAGDPQDSELLLTGARLYAAYAGLFVEESARKQRLAAKSLDYAQRATCLRLETLCARLDAPIDRFTLAVADTGKKDVPLLYGLASAWLIRLQANSADWNALADLPRVTALLQQVVTLDETHDLGGAHTYLGILNSQLPPAMGGKPEVGRRHFERALELANGHNLMVKVQFARYYARLTFDQALHDRLLNEVLGADPVKPGMTLVNSFAQRQALELLKSGKDFF